MEGVWIACESVDGERELKQHFYIPKNNGNARLCGGGFISDDRYSPLSWEEVKIAKEIQKEDCCKKCKKILRGEK